MNIEDFKPDKHSFESIFEKQKEIKFLYEPEAREIFSQFDIDTYEDQEVFKRYCWRITEELMEALEDRKNHNHFREELIDGFNFMVELYLLYGWDFAKVKSPVQLSNCSIEEKVLKVVYYLGVTANVLKNRQWRKSQYLVDLYIFEARFKKIWTSYMEIFYSMGMSDDDISSLWSLKYKVNLFRLKTNY